MVTDEQVERAAAAMTEAAIQRRQEMRDESQRTWGHPGAVTTVRPLAFHDLARIALEEIGMADIQVILAHEKHGDRVIRSADGTLESAALKLLTERVADDYWYEEEEALQAKGILARNDGPAAWRFLDDRRECEYEYVEHQTI